MFKNNGSEVSGTDKDAVFYDSGEGSRRNIRVKAQSHTVTIASDIQGNVTADTEYALTGETITLTLGTTVDASTLKVNDGTSDLTLTDIGNRKYTFVMPDANVTVTATVVETYSVTLPTGMEIVSATNAADGNGKYISGTTVTFKVSFLYTLTSDVSDGTNTLTADDSGNYNVTVGTADITVTATDSDDNILGQTVIRNAPFKANRVTAYKGNLFNIDSGFTLALDGAWDEEYSGEW